MTDIPAPQVFSFFLFLLCPFVFALVAKKLKISPIVGYIIGGLILGNLFGQFINLSAIQSFAYFGIILLLFTVGLEANFSRIMMAKKIIILGGLLQLTISVIFISVTSLFFGFSPLKSFLIGIALSASSTTLVAKIIQDRGEENSFIGEIAMGILIFQDIAFIPFLIIFTSITSASISSFVSLAIGIVVGIIKSTAIIGALFYLGRRIIPRTFNRIARSSRELFNLFIILFIFLVTALCLFLQVPILIGVFVAGVLVGQTVEHYHIFSEVRPLRDLLAVIFFVYIGTNIKLGFIINLIPQILLFTAMIILIKAVILLFIFLFLKFHSRTAFTLSIYLFQIDEAAFILMSVALANAVFPFNEYLFVISSVLLTLLLTPIMIKYKDDFYLRIKSVIKKFLPFVSNFITHRIDRDVSPIDVLQIKNHVVICGYGRIGSYIGRSLMMANIPFVAIDYNFRTVEMVRKEGINIIYGDPCDIDILDYAQAEEAAILILALPEKYTQETIIMNAKKLNPHIYIIGRVHREVDQRRLKDLGVHLIVQPEFEASISIIKRIYLWRNLSREDIINKIRRLKLEHGLS